MKKIGILIVFLLSSFIVYAQDIIPNSYAQYQKLNYLLYNKNTRLTTSIRPFLPQDKVVFKALDSLAHYAVDTTKYTWLGRKLFNEHLIEVKEKDFNFYADLILDLQVGRDKEYRINTWLNTRGFQLGGNIGKQVSFFTSAFENQARFSEYITKYIDRNGIIPGMVQDKEQGRTIKKDWAYATAIINYKPNDHFSFTLGQDKNFIGDGYRSMLLSDVAAPYPFFKFIGTVGNVSYMALYSQFQDPKSPNFSDVSGFRKKWGSFHYVNWNVNNRLSLGFFDSIIWQGQDDLGKRGFDVSYLNPIIFLRPVDGANDSPDNALLGFTAKYKIANNMTIYGQLAADEFTAKEVFGGNGYWSNKFAYQLGFKGFDAFKISRLNYLVEFNTARPFTYSQKSTLLNYGHYVEALAHPMGANFREFLSIWNYQYKRWAFSAQINLAKYGLDDGANVGKDINQSYNTRVKDYGFKTAGGVATNFSYLDARVAYVLNPKYNLRFELGAIKRQEKNALTNDKTTLINFGLRSSFRNIYQDF